MLQPPKFVRFRLLSLSTQKWKELNKKVCAELKPVCDSIFKGQVPLSKSCDVLWQAVQKILLYDPQVYEQVVEQPQEKLKHHKSAAIRKLCARKNELRRHRKQDEGARQDHLLLYVHTMR